MMSLYRKMSMAPMGAMEQHSFRGSGAGRWYCDYCFFSTRSGASIGTTGLLFAPRKQEKLSFIPHMHLLIMKKQRTIMTIGIIHHHPKPNQKGTQPVISFLL
jgi:hypothetical protein